MDVFIRYRCQSCGRLLCEKCCMQGYESEVLVGSSVTKSYGDVEELIMSCKFCRHEDERKLSGKIHPSRASPDPPSPSSIDEIYDCEKIRMDCCPGFLQDRDHDCSFHSATCSSVASFTDQTSPVPFRCSSSRTDGEETDDSTTHFFSPSSEYYQDDDSDIDDTSSISARHDFYNLNSVCSSPSDSPSSIKFTSNRVGYYREQEKGVSPTSQSDGALDHETVAVHKMSEIVTEDPDNTSHCSTGMSVFHKRSEEKLIDFDNNCLIWFPPPPETEDDETEDNFFEYDDEDDDIGESGAMFASSSTLPTMFPAKEKHNEENKEPLRAVVQEHFRALVSQLLQGEGIKADTDNNNVEDWLYIVTKLAWQAANSVKPDTSRGGSMDPGDYIKVKCIANGKPSESTFIKGVVCTKNIKHKRMTSQYNNPRLLLLGGALEYQRVPNQLSSFNTLLQQEIEHLKRIISKIEAHRPNVLLVEKSVSSYAQEYLLAKEISLVLNVKWPLLERIARCTGALITPSIESISTARLGHCELFRLERVSEDLHTANDLNKKSSSKTLMFFEGCRRPLGCTVLLKGTCREELKKLKHVVQYAVFAAYHLSLETSFIADEGGSVPTMTLKPSISIEDTEATVNVVSDLNCSDFTAQEADLAVLNGDVGGWEASSDNLKFGCLSPMSPCFMGNVNESNFDADNQELTSNLRFEVKSPKQNIKINESTITFAPNIYTVPELLELTTSINIDQNESSNEFISATDSHQRILVSFSSHCVLKGTLCERSRLLRIKFYGSFDKPLGKYLHDNLFNQTKYCQSCNELAEAHFQCFTHQQGSLTINVRSLPNSTLPGARDGKIWMWHRCLRCSLVDGVPPATRRVIMSDAAWGLSFGKFLELSFSNHATANRVATCGHSLQRDCLRYYGFGSMVAFFRYTPIEILSVHLPPLRINSSNHVQQDWLRKEAEEILCKMKNLYAEISSVLHSFEHRSASSGHKSSETAELHNHILELKNLVEEEKNYYNGVLHPPNEVGVDILKFNCLRHSLVIASRVWDRRIYLLNSILKTKGYNMKETIAIASYYEHEDGKLGSGHEENNTKPIKLQEAPRNELCPEHKAVSSLCVLENDVPQHSLSSILSDKIDCAWTGTDHLPVRAQGQFSQIDNPPLERLKSPMRVYSFDSAIRVQDRIRKGFPPSAHLSTLRSFHASGEYRHMVRDPVSSLLSSYSQISLQEAKKARTTPLFSLPASQISQGARLLIPHPGRNNIVIAVYDNEPTSIISYALSCKEYEDLITDKNDSFKEGSIASSFLVQPFGSLDLNYTNYGSEEASLSTGSLFTESKRSPHLRISFGDESLSAAPKVKFYITCYFAKQFDIFRKKCCPGEIDFVRSLSRCRRWSAQGGKSNVYFAKSLDERFIIKQVTKTELDSFQEFAPEYFKYLTNCIVSGSPTCLAKIMGIYQVSVKHLNGGKETKMDLMVMENVFFKRNISRVYDLKGSTRSRYNPDTTGENTVLLDMNLLETLRTKPIFLGSKAKRSLERAVWNDTSFLASVDVMDYSLLVGVDEERKALVIGIIDIMRQYTWDKQLETWVKASGILGGPKNASPTIISPKQYKRRFRKAMTTYFLTVPDHWSM